MKDDWNKIKMYVFYLTYLMLDIEYINYFLTFLNPQKCLLHK